MVRSHIVSTLLVALVVGASGCTALERMEAPSLKSSPETSGLVVVEADITVIAAILGIKSSADPAGGLVVRVDGTHQSVEGGASSGYVIFPDVPPGRWQLVMIEGEWQSGSGSTWIEYGVPLESADAFTLDVRAGEPVYVAATIEDDRHIGGKGVSYHRRTDAAAEQKAWKWMSDIYDKSSWAPVFRAKL